MISKKKKEQIHKEVTEKFNKNIQVVASKCTILSPEKNAAGNF